MDKLEQQLFTVLSNNSGFYIKDYYSNVSKKNKWIAILEKDDFIYAVVVEDEKYANTTFIEATEYIKNKYTKRAGINVVITTENSDCDLNGFDNYSKLVYSLKDKVIVYSHEGCKPLVSFIEYINKKEIKKKNRFKDNGVTYTLMGINIITFLVSVLFSSIVIGYGGIYNIDIETLTIMGAKVNYLIDEGQVWRVITSAFLHGGVVHLFFNMYALKIIGAEAEYAYGKMKYIIIYIISAIGGGVFSYMFNPNSTSVGASGAIFGLFGAMLIYGYRHRDRIGKKYMMSLVKVIGVNVIIGLTMSNIDNSGHMGGLIFGIITAIIISYNYKASK